MLFSCFTPSIAVFLTLLSNCRGIALPGATCDNLNNAEKVDCHPEAWNGKDLFSVKETCHKRGCCWREATGETFPGFQVATPWCFFPSDYENYEIRDFHETHDKLTIALQKTSGTPSFGLSNDSIHIELQVTSVSDDLVRVRVTDIEHRRFVVPAPALNDHSHELSSKKLYKVSFDSFTGRLEILRSSSLKSVFSVNVKQIIFSDQFIQITNEDIPSSVLYGLGENMDDFRKDFSKSFKKIMMYNSDHAPAKNLPLYGTHPFYLMKEKPDEGSPERATKAHGVLFFNNNIQEMTLSPRPSITYRTTGGILDFFIFMGPTNNDVIAQKTKLLGKTDMIPLWSLGFQLCRWGYKNTREITDVYERTVKAGIPLDVKWVDIDYMSKRNDFVIDQQNFTELPAFAKKVRESGRKFIPILDPAVSAAEPKGTYPPYDEGIEMDIFVKNEDGSNFIGQVWNWETSIFPDFSHPRATEYWTRQLKRFSDELEFDGIWIDMNEPANFFDGQKEGLCTRNRWNNPPFMPGLDNNQYATRKTMCPSAKQFLGSHYDLHNMYAFYEAKATHSALKSIFPSKRPYIVSRATVTGQNIYSHHWTGDVYSNWESLKNSIFDIQSMNLYGFPMVGADICGFTGEASVELCARWQALGSFYPFSRNHNTIEAKPQDPVAMGDTVVAATKNALRIRYTLLPYLYSVFYENFITGHPVIRSANWDSPWDENAELEAATQFLWGTSVMIIPAVEEGKQDVRGYFPTENNWFDFESLTEIKSKDDAKREHWYNIPLEKIVVTLKGASVIPYHVDPKMTTSQQHKESPFGLLVTLTQGQKSTGRLFWDDGETADTVNLGSYSLIEFEADNNKLKSIIREKNFKMNPLKEVKVLGIKSSVNEVKVNGKVTKEFKYDDKVQVLILDSLKQDLTSEFVIEWK